MSTRSLRLRVLMHIVPARSSVHASDGSYYFVRRTLTIRGIQAWTLERAVEPPSPIQSKLVFNNFCFDIYTINWIICGVKQVALYKYLIFSVHRKCI